MADLEALLDAADLMVDLAWTDREMEIGAVSVRAITAPPQRITLSVPSTGQADYSDAIEATQQRWGPYRRLRLDPDKDEREQRTVLELLVANRRTDEAFWWQRGGRVVALVHSTLEPETGVLGRFRKPVHGGHLWILVLPATAVPFTGEDLARLRTTRVDPALMVQLALDEEYDVAVLSRPVSHAGWSNGWDRYLLDVTDHDEFLAEPNLVEAFLAECDEGEHDDRLLAGSEKLRSHVRPVPDNRGTPEDEDGFGSPAARIAHQDLARSRDFDAWLATELGERFAMTSEFHGIVVVFAETDAQRDELIDPGADVEAFGGTPVGSQWRDDWTSAYRRMVAPYDPFGVLTAARIDLRVCSRERLDRHYEGSTYYFWL